MTALKLTKTVLLKAPPSHVWKFLTEADRLALWFMKGESDVAEGGDWALVSNSLGKEGTRACWGRVIEFDPPRKLVHTFTHNHMEGVETTCTWTLEAVEAGTVLTLIHEGWEKIAEDAFKTAADHDTGWDEFLARLRRVTA